MLGVAPPSTPTRSPLVGAPLAALSRSGALSYEGATLGPYKGRVTAVGGTIGYNFTLGHTPISTRLKVLREVEVENRFRGTIGLDRKSVV